MGKKSELSAEQRVRLVLRLFEQRRAGGAECAARWDSGQTLYRWRDEFINAGKRALNGGGIEATQAKAIARLSAQLAERDQGIGELTLANRMLKKVSGGLS
ncbi:MAG TPA: hypothetical protein VHH93_00260 [Gammaproteobacteria bacterium]|nr:hypothetical protein [Gammaproteobacteria bacterium]